MFRNLILFQLPGDAIPTQQALIDALAEHPLRDPGPIELSTRGFVSPLGRGQDQLVRTQGDHSLLALGSCHRMLPAQVVNDALAEKLDAIEAQRGRRPGGKERSRLKDEVLAELIPQAFLQRRRTLAWLDHATGVLTVDTSSRKAAEEALSDLREALGTFPAIPMVPMTSARLTLTGWLTGDALPDDFTLGDQVELKDPGDDGAVVRARRQDLGADEVIEHVNAGKQVSMLAVGYDDRLAFILDENLVVRGLRFSDVVLEQLGDCEDPIAELDARLALMVGELRRLYARLAQLFDLDLSTLKLDGGAQPPSVANAARAAAQRLHRMAASEGLTVTLSGPGLPETRLGPGGLE